MAVADNTHAVYARNAAQFDEARGKTLFERPWLERFCAGLPRGGAVLDVGCGAGEPIARYFIEQGYAVTGVDFAEPLLEMARARFPSARFPSADWVVQDMRRLDLGRQYDGVIAWHSYFHLTPDEQTLTLPLLAGHAAPGGVLMITVGPQAGERTGRVAGEPVYHASLAEDDYRRLLDDAGMDVVDFVRNDESCGGATILLAMKRGTPDG